MHHSHCSAHCNFQNFLDASCALRFEFCPVVPALIAKPPRFLSTFYSLVSDVFPTGGSLYQQNVVFGVRFYLLIFFWVHKGAGFMKLFPADMHRSQKK